MRIAVNLVVEMTPDQVADYRLAYGPQNIREDVKRYVLNHVQGAPAFEYGEGGTVTLKGE